MVPVARAVDAHFDTKDVVFATVELASGKRGGSNGQIGTANLGLDHCRWGRTSVFGPAMLGSLT